MNLLLSQLKYPILLSPMLGIVTPGMVADISNAGGLGGLPLGGLSMDVARKLIRETKELTNSIFAVNLFVNDEPDLKSNETAIEHMKNFIAGIFKEKNWVEKNDFQYSFYPYQDLIDIIIEEEVKVVSFTFGIPDFESIHKLKNKGISMIGVATCAEEAILLENSGMDMVVAQGIEAGGHRASFIQGELPEIGLFSLIPQMVDAIKIPVIAAGGIYDGRTMSAAFHLGASAVQIGSHFIHATDSLANNHYREILKNSADTSTMLTKSFTGRWARGFRNEFMKRTAGMNIPEYPIQNILTKGLRAQSKEHGDYQYASLWAGQNARFGNKKSTLEIMNELVRQYEQIKIEELQNFSHSVNENK